MSNIVNNPFFMLGVYVNAPTKDILANKSKISAYSKVNKCAEFPIDVVVKNLNITILNRTQDLIEYAFNQISRPNEKIRLALYGLADYTQFDQMALQYIQVGNTVKAKELLGKKENWSSVLNLATIASAEGNVSDSIRHILKLIHTNKYRQDFCHAVCGEEYSIPVNELKDAFLSSLKEDESSLSIFPSSDFPDDYSELQALILSKYSSQIAKEISTAKQVASNDSEASYAAGMSLIRNTEEALSKLKLLADSMQYQTTADALAKQILQCGINYYNNSKQKDAAIKALVIQKKAEEIAVGKLAKERCQENTKILQENIENMPPSEVLDEFEKVHSIIGRHKEDTCNDGLSLLTESAPTLVAIKEKVGKDNEKYQKLSDLVANVALGKVIAQINELIDKINHPDAYRYSSLNKYGSLYDSSMATLNARATLIGCTGTAWKVIRSIESLDTTQQFKSQRLLPNKKTLSKLRQDLVPSSSDESAIDMRTSSQKEADLKAKKKRQRIGWSFGIIGIAALVGIIWWSISTEDDRSWNSATSIYSVKQYISNHPSGKHINEAHAYVFNQIKAEGITALDDYVRAYPESPFKKEAQTIADRMTDSLYNIAEKNHTVEAWNAFIASVPSNRKSDAAEKIEQIKKEAELLKWNTEARAWKTASTGNTQSLYETYLEKYPNGAHASAAKKKIIDIRVNNIYAGEHGTLPTMDQTSYGYGSTSSVTVKNDTGYTLTLLYSSTGHSREVILSVGQSKTFSLPNGTYRVAASVSAARVSNYVSTEQLNGGGYSSSYYIVTTRY